MSSTTIKFIHKMSNISKFSMQFTPDVMIQGVPWRVQFRKYCGLNLGVYLMCKNEDKSRNWSHTACFTVKFLSFKKSVKPVEEHTSLCIFDHANKCSGICNFDKWERLTNIENGFVRDDTILVEIKIEVADPNYENKSILKFDVFDTCCRYSEHRTFRLSVSNIDALMAVETPEFILRGLRWKMSIYNRSDWLEIQLSTVEIGKSITCETTVIFKLISTKDDAKSIEHKLIKKMYGHDILTKKNFVSWVELFDDQNGFVHDNAIVFEVKIVTELHNIDCSGKKRKTANDQNEDAKSPKLECSICLDVIRDQEVSSLSCTHLFCTNCITDTIKAHKKCPVCNDAAKLTDLRRIRLPFAN